ncbi:MAG TPA: radical SAM protein, partial [Abditibacteriaceae bacterium]
MPIALAPRDYVIEQYTRTVCPACFEERGRRSDEAGVWKDGMLVSHDEKIWLRRFCAAHGETESLYEEDAAIWRARNGWNTPTLRITPDRSDNFAGFPDGYREGLPASHGQHTCILLLNITDRCNYGCTTCFASSSPPGTPVARDERPAPDDVLHTVKTILAREGGKLSVLMLSGGEPTVREDLTDLLLRLFELNITRIVLNTNGRRIVRDDRFLQFLHEHRNRIEIYLQFDGLRAATYQSLRNEDVAQEKQTALQRLNDAHIFTTLVTTVKHGINDDEVGDIIQLGLETPRCAGVALQPVFGSGRSAGIDAHNRTTPTGILSRMSAQTGGLIGHDDFIPLPCSHSDCCDITYLVQA